MVAAINICGALIVTSTGLLIVSWILYGILYLIGAIAGKEIINNIVKRIVYIITVLPFLTSGVYLVGIPFLIKANSNEKVVLFLLGVFLIIYPLIRLYRKFQDLKYFGGVWWPWNYHRWEYRLLIRTIMWWMLFRKSKKIKS